jgi:hypothetical protein
MKRIATVLALVLALAGAFLLGRMQLPAPALESEPQPLPDEVAAAWANVHAAPSDPNAWAQLGDVQSAAGDLISAEHAYLTAIRMGGDNALAYARLGFLHYAKQEDDRALAYLDEAKQRGASVPMLDFTIDALRSRNAHAEAEPIENAEVKRVDDAGIDPLDAGASEPDASVEEEPQLAEKRIDEPEIAHVAPPDPSPVQVRPPDGQCSIPAQRIEQGRTYVVPVAVYGHWANLIIDTGASITVVTKEFADAVRLPRDRSAVVRAITANGRVEFETAIVPDVVLADRVAQNVRVAVCDSCEGVADGLLGLDLVAAFGLRLDLANAVIHFADCD